MFIGKDVHRAEVGEGIEYSFTIKNTGSTTLYDIEMTSGPEGQALVSSAEHVKQNSTFCNVQVFADFASSRKYCPPRDCDHALHLLFCRM